MELIVFFLLVANFAISWFNAWTVGKVWVETKAVGGFTRFMAWMGAVMSACGFVWVYTIVLALLWHTLNPSLPKKYVLSDVYLNGAIGLGYLIIILPVLGSGLAITINSWAYFWRRRTFGSGALAGYNSFAQLYNTYQAIQGIPEAVGLVGKAFKGDGDSDGKKWVLMLALVLIALVGGILTTTAIIRVSARSSARSVAEKFNFGPGRSGFRYKEA
jgi:hypothetical protein